MKLYVVYSLESHHRGDSNAYTKRTIIELTFTIPKVFDLLMFDYSPKAVASLLKFMEKYKCRHFLSGERTPLCILSRVFETHSKKEVKIILSIV